ncbi:MAG: helix-turn-helix transcriptional regulator [Desulfobacteraceae bacterium]|nr:helix-turn-helix transcriptional regulator [Desulfobacteraceae bacterium]
MKLNSYNGRSDQFSKSVMNYSDRIDSPESFETSTSMISRFYRLAIRNLDLRPGLSIEIYDQFHHIELLKKFHFTYPSFRIVFYMLGDGRTEEKALAGGRRGNFYSMSGGYCTIAFFPELEGIIRIKEMTRSLQVVVNISPSILHTFIDTDHAAFPKDIRVITEGLGKQRYYHIGRISASMHSALYEILNCPYTGTIRKIFMESKALELVAYKLVQLKASETGFEQPNNLNREENDQIHYAKLLLVNNMENPPTLFDLARKVGLSHTKLNAGFRKIYGTTVFGCLQRIRLEHAKYLMGKEGFNVTEAAFAVGYNSVPSFSRAFSLYFKQPPKKVAKKAF